MNVAGIRTCDIANGSGVRVTLFVSGCRNNCPGCFNKDAQRFDYGEEFTKEHEKLILDSLGQPWVTGFTCLGGEPMEPENQVYLIPLFKKIKEMYPTKTIWCYTGYVYDKDLIPGGRRYIYDVTNELLKCIDVLVDGPFVMDLKDPSLKFRGSSNQRIIHFTHTQGSDTPEVTYER